MKILVLLLDVVLRVFVNWEIIGVFKLVVDVKILKVLGVYVVVENVGDVIYAVILVVKFGLIVGDLREMMVLYLIMVEGLKLVVLIFDKDVLKLFCCVG